MPSRFVTRPSTPFHLCCSKMPAFYASPQTIALLPSGPWPNRPHAHPREREVNREIILDVAPDREALLMSNKSIDELRQILKIRIGPAASHWLYRNRKRINANLRDGNSRISTLIRGGPSMPNETTTSNLKKKEIHILRRVLSTSSISPFSNSMSGIDSRFYRPSPHGDNDIDVWGSVVLCSAEKLISPRPLGPTHILIVHSSPGSSRVYRPVKGGGRRPLRRKLSTLSNVVELPVNDLLFVLNVPNLAPAVPVLPPRLHKELPRVLMYVPHLETFPELVVYLHTQNQAELFRKLIPEWIRDLMHPFPEVNSELSTVSSISDSRNIAKVPLQLLGMLISGSGSNSSVESLGSSYHDALFGGFQYKRTIKSVAVEIAEAAQSPAFIDSDGPDPILHTVALLNALRDNFEHIGYFAKPLWNELDIYRDVLIRSVSCQARIRSAIDLEE
ncbi:hypothetical protein D9615_003482 [Tricholomella constricta]|uniref:Uncharacterized protein n=1 Tax=Tricholomella constricta TaxID=117010 RepID=A0A8H5M7S4_9AGAR|nr:hypothetical protein D9615_003482 [Tricholomella constricta]